MRTRIPKCAKNIAPGDSAGKAAVSALRKRLEAVLHFLPLAAKKADKDIEYVHKLRVWTRRATAALKLYDEFLPRRHAVWLKKRLKRIRQATGDARDYDVLAQFLTHDPSHQPLKLCLNRLRNLREEAQEPIIAIRKRLKRGDRFDRQLKKLLRRVRQDGETKIPPFSRWAQARLRPILKNFFEAAPGKEGGLDALHQFRIRSKELRYAMELLAGGFPSDFRRKLYPIVKNMQDKLGAINDLAMMQTRLQQLLNDTDNVGEKRHLLYLLTQEQTRLEQARQDFLEWHAPHLDRLRDEFSNLLTPKLVWKSEKGSVRTTVINGRFHAEQAKCPGASGARM